MSKKKLRDKSQIFRLAPGLACLNRDPGIFVIFGQSRHSLSGVDVALFQSEKWICQVEISNTEWREKKCRLRVIRGAGI